MAVDASASTGTNTIRMGTDLSLGDNITGGSGTDTIVADLNAAVQYLPTSSAVETLEIDFSAASTLNLNNMSGVQTFTLTDQGAAVVVSNASDSMTAINIGKGTAVTGTNNITVGYKSGASSAQTVTVGATASASNPAIDTGDLTITGNTGALTITSGGDAASLLDAVAANNASAVTIQGGTQNLTTTTVSATGAATFTVDASNKATTVTNVTLDQSTSAINVTSGTGNVSVGNVTLTGAAADVDVDATVTGNGTTTTGVGIISVDFVDAKAGTADLIATNNSTGAMTITEFEVIGRQDDQSGSVNIAATSGNVTLTTLDIVSQAALRQLR